MTWIYDDKDLVFFDFFFIYCHTVKLIWITDKTKPVNGLSRERKRKKQNVMKEITITLFLLISENRLRTSSFEQIN